MDNIMTIDEFIEYTWDYVSPFIVSDDYWEKNNEFIREITFSLYELYKNVKVTNRGKADDVFVTAKFYGKVLEALFSNLNKFEIKRTFIQENHNF